MSGHCPGCGVYHEEEDSRLCAQCHNAKLTLDEPNVVTLPEAKPNDTWQYPDGPLFSPRVTVSDLRRVREMAEAEPIDPNVKAHDVPRLTGQNAAILELLREKPRTNRELAAVSLKYTSRISDIRAAGHSILNTTLHGGLTLYTLIREKQQ